MKSTSSAFSVLRVLLAQPHSLQPVTQASRSSCLNVVQAISPFKELEKWEKFKSAMEMGWEEESESSYPMLRSGECAHGALSFNEEPLTPGR